MRLLRVLKIELLRRHKRHRNRNSSDPSLIFNAFEMGLASADFIIMKRQYLYLGFVLLALLIRTHTHTHTHKSFRPSTRDV